MYRKRKMNIERFSSFPIFFCVVGAINFAFKTKNLCSEPRPGHAVAFGIWKFSHIIYLRPETKWGKGSLFSFFIFHNFLCINRGTFQPLEKNLRCTKIQKCPPYGRSIQQNCPLIYIRWVNSCRKLFIFRFLRYSQEKRSFFTFFGTHCWTFKKPKLF